MSCYHWYFYARLRAVEISDAQFDKLISAAMDELPQDYIQNLHNVAVTFADTPTSEQRLKLKMRQDHLLLGLFEGVPRIHQTGNESGLLPSKITLFKYDIVAMCNNENELRAQIKRTLWHEIAHYYGLNHDHMNALQNKARA